MPPRPIRRKYTPKPQPRATVSTWPFRDGYPWDEELIRNTKRALSTHGRSLHLTESHTSGP